MKMSNRWNQFIYRLWAPIYDGTVNRLFAPGRQRAFEIVNLQPGERVLLVGVGTGADLPLLSEGVCAVGVDLSTDMLAKARSKVPLPRREIMLVQGDAQDMPLKEAYFDVAVLNLILSVVPDGRLCLISALRALKPGGRAIIFDKFMSDHGQVTLIRRIMNFFSTLFGTDINRRLGEMVAGTDWEIVRDEPGILGGIYRVILLRSIHLMRG